MAKYGNPMDGHIEPHFDPDTGFCWCPCDECTTSLRFCVCYACPCEEQSDHEAGQPDEVEWVTIGTISPSGAVSFAPETTPGGAS